MPLTGSSQIEPFSIELEELNLDITISSKKLDRSPQIAGFNDGTMVVVHDVVSGMVNNTSKNVYKYDLSTGKEVYRSNLDNIEFKDRKLYFEDYYESQGILHLLYRTEKQAKDSVHLIDFIVDKEGELQRPESLLASWVESKRGSDNIEFGWNSEGTRLTVIAVQRDEASGNAILLRRIFDEGLKPLQTYRYDTGKKFGDFQMVKDYNSSENSYVFAVVRSDKGNSLGILKLGAEGMKVTGVSLGHQYVDDITFHEVAGRLHFSYLSFEDEDHDELNGFHSSIISFSEPQKQVTDINYADNLKNKNKDLYSFLREKESYALEDYSIHSILEHPEGGYILILHQMYAYMSQFEVYPEYFSEDYLITYISPEGEMLWQKAFPMALGANTAKNLNHLVSFDENNNLVFLTIDSDKNIEKWKKGKFKKYSSGNLGIAAIQISPEGDVRREIVWRDEGNDKIIIPSIPNLWQIKSTKEFYALASMPKRQVKLVKIKMSTLDLESPKAQYEVKKFGKQY